MNDRKQQISNRTYTRTHSAKSEEPRHPPPLIRPGILARWRYERREGGSGTCSGETDSNGTHRDELPQVRQFLLPQEAAGEELAGEDDEQDCVENELEDPQAADFDLFRRVRFQGLHLLASCKLLVTLLLTLQPFLVCLLTLGAVLGISVCARSGQWVSTLQKMRCVQSHN